jgi:hypothetical protein
MGNFEKEHKIALISCLETVLMRMGNTKYNLLVAKLNARHDLAIRDSYDHPEHLKSVLKEVYQESYNHIITEVKIMLDGSVKEDIANFFKIMES